MRLSCYFLPTLRQVPSDVEVISHGLMVRAGLIMQLASGIYSYLPAGLKVIKKIESVVRSCMNSAGAIELLMPAVQPAELWKESGRWGNFGKELLRLLDRHNREFCFGPTHEEVVTDIVRKHIKSYRQLPINLYQIQTKFRDEIRPRFGLMRGREFIMKDAYSFDKDEEGCKISYDKMYKAYSEIFDRLGLKYKVVEADTGAIGGNISHEFMVLADTGEDVIVYCDSCGYTANLEKAAVLDVGENILHNMSDIKEVVTPSMKTVSAVASYLGVDIKNIVKTLILKCSKGFFAILVRGDHEVNLIKVKNAYTNELPVFASEEEILRVTGGPLGFSGPIGINIPIFADNAIKYMKNFVVGANKKDTHLINVNINRDFKVDGFFDLRNAKKGDICVKCKGQYNIERGIEVGHIFMLGTKYSVAMKAYYSDENSNQKPIVMGCYGIGIGRIAAAAIEQNHDDKGIIWPASIAPFEVIILTLNQKDGVVLRYAEKIYKTLKDRGVDVLYDDRDVMAGVKFNDADLVGYPIRINVGKKSIEKKEVEIFVRKDSKVIRCSCENTADRIVEILKSL